MNDSWGDGGTAYSVADPDGNVLASAGAFDYSSTSSADFCVGDVAIPGCTDETACNYNAAATEDDGSCATLIMNFSTSNDSWTGETGFNVVNNDTGEIVDSMSAWFLQRWPCDVCVADNACYYIVVTDSFGDGNGSSGSWSLDYNGASVVSGGGNWGSADTSDSFCFGPGCSDAGASNFRQQRQATMGLANTFGCTDAAACNYNESATTDDGSCAYQSLSVVINPDNFKGETSWSLVNDSLEVVGSGLAEGADLCEAEACYTFTIFDSWGDGICCAFGNGDYSVTDGQGQLLASVARSVQKSLQASACLQSSVVRTRWRVTILKRTTQKTVLAITHASVAWIQLQRTTTQQATQENEGSCIY